MPTARRTELPTRRTVSLRSSVPSSGVGDIFQLIYSTIADVDRDDEHEFLTADDDDNGEGEGAATGNWNSDPPTESWRQLSTFPIRTPANETSESSTSSEITPTPPPPPRTTTNYPHSMYNPEGSRMGERRRSPGVDYQQTAASTSAYMRGPPPPQRSTTLPEPTRYGTPPASSYFLTTQGGDNAEPQPIVADADSHFAYSTTLRRHHYELTSPTTAIQNFTHGNWQGALDSFSRGTSSRHSLDHPPPNRVPHSFKAPGTPQNTPETPSSKFSHSTIEVWFASKYLRAAVLIVFVRKPYFTSGRLPPKASHPPLSPPYARSMVTTNFLSRHPSPFSSNLQRQSMRPH